MSEHPMTTRLRSKTLKQTDIREFFGKVTNDKRVRLTEDLLYIVNKKLQTMDRSARIDKIIKYQSRRVFKELYYRQKPRGYSQEELTVMHKVYFDSNATAESGYDSMKDFQTFIWDEWFPGDGFMDTRHDYPVDEEISRPDLFRFVKLPDDYKPLSNGYNFFDDLSWKENGAILVKAAQIPKFMLIYEFNQWFTDHTQRFPLDCSRHVTVNGPSPHCDCREIYPLLWSGGFFRRIFRERGIEPMAGISTFPPARAPVTVDTRLHHLLDMVEAMNEYVGRLSRKEIVLDEDHGLNLLAAFQLKILAEKLGEAHLCEWHYVDNYDWQSYWRRHELSSQ